MHVPRKSARTRQSSAALETSTLARLTVRPTRKLHCGQSVPNGVNAETNMILSHRGHCSVIVLISSSILLAQRGPGRRRNSPPIASGLNFEVFYQRPMLRTTSKAVAVVCSPRQYSWQSSRSTSHFELQPQEGCSLPQLPADFRISLKAPGGKTPHRAGPQPFRSAATASSRSSSQKPRPPRSPIGAAGGWLVRGSCPTGAGWEWKLDYKIWIVAACRKPQFRTKWPGSTSTPRTEWKGGGNAGLQGWLGSGPILVGRLVGGVYWWHGHARETPLVLPYACLAGLRLDGCDGLAVPVGMWLGFPFNVAQGLGGADCGGGGGCSC